MQKVVNKKSKAGLRFSIIVWDLDTYCSTNYCPFYNTFSKVQTQGLTIKKSKPEESKPKKSKLDKKKSSALPSPIAKIRDGSSLKKKLYSGDKR